MRRYCATRWHGPTPTGGRSTASLRFRASSSSWVETSLYGGGDGRPVRAQPGRQQHPETKPSNLNQKEIGAPS